MMSTQQHCKSYHDEALDAKVFVESHFSHGQIAMIEENVVFPLRVLHKLASKGVLKGSKMIDLSIGATAFQLFPVCNIYKEIYVMEFTDSNIEHFKLWLDKDEKATDWSFSAKRACQLEGNKQDWKKKEDQARQAVKGVFKWENCQTNPIDPKLVPEVDCVLSIYVLSVVCKTKEEFQNGLKNAVSRLKMGGHLVLFTPLNMSFYRVGKNRFFVLTMDEKTLQELVINAGFVIEKSGSMKSVEKCDLVDYSHMCYVLACKVKEV
ncbi:indolethylamine N-methyltransferase-like [Hyperolius riggenbachi]|uniref:indolethylamine N-methyltransferase-like n=1 Tax=Hyperolius riggenbachi TaxID=752182 RepID=UPI0035A30CCC